MTDIQRGDYVRYQEEIYEVWSVDPDNGLRIGSTYVSAHLVEKIERQYTPGPWRWEFMSTAGNYFLVGSNGAVTHGGPNSKDGRLMEATPELLEACQEALGWIYEQDSDIRPYGVIDALESAIKKALRQA